ncbi:hypothetical protein KZF77_003848 [Escherichia coli]|uniref:tRNA_anti-like n=1 Tax=Escherichia coli TaxID=562 RepID=A0A8S7FGN4_ECOLX|nr:hypothetical protein [Escherichia coli]EFC0014136.1 hypothetical protein [Escherichia coli]EFD0306123.1 hypothetical protein [Escherichia coli]EFD2065822.1 hypothetical protein [Escherichia coli]EFE7560594.1 hypothetical protein [Escherichia coli]
MRKFLVLSFMLFPFMSFADGGATSGIQPYPEYVANYLKTLFTVSCERALKGDSKSEDVVVKQATQRMKKDTESYATIHKAVVFGSAIGKYLKEGSVIFEDQKDRIEVNNCDEGANYFTTQKFFMKKIVATMVSLEQQQTADDESKEAASDINIYQRTAKVYRTTAKALAELYDANEVAADDKIGGRKVEITGTVQEIAKNFTNDVIVRLESGNRFLPVMLSMEDSEKSKASKLKKGQKIVVTCEKMQLFVRAPSGSNCTFN